MGQRKQLWILLLFFGLVGLFSGFAIWQISQSQQKDRELARVKTDLEQTTQQLKILKDQNTASLTSRGKLQKDLDTLKKQLQTFQKEGLALEEQLKAAQTQNSTLTSENTTLKVRLSVTEKQLASLEQTLRPSGGGPKPTPKATTEITPNFLKP